ncbi:acylneuraminate cytidylyltransferase family protein [Chitinophaga ginsengisegetis]|uniref:acylneuraminate cytidylyltransferase family protein n=1 Tax=Chitinophaga ginsengisegetis TaxID=393003 RepID=UPI00343A0F5E
MNPLFLIPARGGSKGVPGKNTKLLHNKPLIQYSIEVAMAVTNSENICISTDDANAMRIATDNGIVIPFQRPPHLATDTAATRDVCLHALDFYREKGIIYDTLVLLQPTSPFRSPDHVRDAMALYDDEIDMVVSVKETSANPYYVLFEENEQGFLSKSKSGNYTRRQDCPKVWEYNGAVYIINVKALRDRPVNEFKKIRKYVMDEYASVDIDSQLDWDWAEFLLQRK